MPVRRITERLGNLAPLMRQGLPCPDEQILHFGLLRNRKTSCGFALCHKFLPLPVPPAETLVPCSKTILSYSEICAVSGEMKQGLAKQFDAETNRHLHKMNRYLHIE